MLLRMNYFCSKLLILIFVLFMLALSNFNWLRIAESKTGMTDSGLPVLITISAIILVSPPFNLSFKKKA